MRTSFEKIDSDDQSLNFSSEQSDARKELKVVEYLGGEVVSVDQSTGVVSERRSCRLDTHDFEGFQDGGASGGL